MDRPPLLAFHCPMSWLITSRVRGHLIWKDSSGVARTEQGFKRKQWHSTGRSINLNMNGVCFLSKRALNGHQLTTKRLVLLKRAWKWVITRKEGHQVKYIMRSLILIEGKKGNWEPWKSQNTNASLCIGAHQDSVPSHSASLHSSRVIASTLMDHSPPPCRWLLKLHGGPSSQALSLRVILSHILLAIHWDVWKQLKLSMSQTESALSVHTHIKPVLLGPWMSTATSRLIVEWCWRLIATSRP